MRLAFEYIKTELLDYFDGTGTHSLNRYEVAGATHSPYELKDVLLYNNQDLELDQHQPTIYPMCYISFGSETEWNQLPMSVQQTAMEFDIKFKYESYLEMEDDLDIFNFWTEIVNKTEQLWTKSEEFNMSQPKRLRDNRLENESNIWSADMTFQTNILDKSMMKFKYTIIDDYSIKMDVIKGGCGRPIEVIDGGDSTENEDSLQGVLDDTCVDLDAVDGGTSSFSPTPPYPDQINVDGGNSTSF